MGPVAMSFETGYVTALISRAGRIRAREREREGRGIFWNKRRVNTTAPTLRVDFVITVFQILP